jgi:hypothetical protein
VNNDRVTLVIRRHRKSLGKCFFGDSSLGVDARTIEDALQVCREFARALDQSDIQQTETLYDFELRIGRNPVVRFSTGQHSNCHGAGA